MIVADTEREEREWRQAKIRVRRFWTGTSIGLVTLLTSLAALSLGIDFFAYLAVVALFGLLAWFTAWIRGWRVAVVVFLVIPLMVALLEIVRN